MPEIFDEYLGYDDIVTVKGDLINDGKGDPCV
jgi:hypothetical protein